MKLNPKFEEKEIERLKELKDLLIKMDNEEIVGSTSLECDYSSEFFPYLYNLLVEDLDSIISEIDYILQ